MSTLKCKNCGGLTNTALSKYNLRNISDGAEECYAVWINNKWERGCAFDENSDEKEVKLNENE